MVNFIRIQRLHPYIAILLVCLFGITFVPFNALHNHEEETHAVAVLTHAGNHHCKLDDDFCQNTFKGTCQHPSHIGKTAPKCFSCKFHFIKSFDFIARFCIQVSPFIVPNPFIRESCSPLSPVFLPDNKGPPVMA